MLLLEMLICRIFFNVEVVMKMCCLLYLIILGLVVLIENLSKNDLNEMY